jgi:hypothetical protein
MPEVISYQAALAGAPQGKRHVLLGNGFSRACRNDIFAYDALFDRADFAGLCSEARAVFTALGTKDFERVMRALREASAIAKVYAVDRPELATRLETDATHLREVLASAIASSHPARPRDIEDARYGSCRMFLSTYDRIYTVNYDLLLYWALMQNELEPQVACDDGFRQPDDGPAEYVTWEVQNTDQQTVHYLHGALHVFDAGAEVQKFTWSGTQIALIDQIRAALASNRYPLFVAEGTAREKMERIQHSGLLNRSYRSFASIGGSLFVYGLGMKDNDDHILKLIEDGKIRYLAVSVFGSPDSDENRSMIARARSLAANRPTTKPLTVRFFDAASAQVWGA